MTSSHRDQAWTDGGRGSLRRTCKGEPVPEAGWLDEAVRGAAGLVVFGGLFVAARLRFRKGSSRGAGDVGLD